MHSAQKQDLTKLVSEQELSPAEAVQMNAELERHKQALSVHEEKRSKLQTHLGGLEADISQSLKRVEVQVQQCNANESRLQAV